MTNHFGKSHDLSQLMLPLWHKKYGEFSLLALTSQYSAGKLFPVVPTNLEKLGSHKEL